MSAPSIKHVQVEVACACGEVMEFCDLKGDDFGSMISQSCDECGERVEISVDADIQMIVNKEN